MKFIMLLVTILGALTIRSASGQPATGQISLVTPIPATTGDAEVDFLIALSKREDSSGQAHNPFNYLGKFQLGELALVDAGFYIRAPNTMGNVWNGEFTERARFIQVSSVETFLQSVGAQELAVRAYHQKQWNAITALGLSRKIGSVIGGVRLTKSGMIAASHLVGVTALESFIQSNGVIVPMDGNKTPVTSYMSMFGQFY